MNLTVDQNRIDYDKLEEYRMGISVRATLKGRWGSHDIATLDAESLLAWLRSRGGENALAEDVVGVLFGHGKLHTS